ncbi:hypothetical protein [Streptomyces pinistramenti]|uniref:hypothetical protein n=1 Tax=Streptomyces pinistramenti TaxID=2884812 RepID=UPI001D06719B|nr:hypothetical protein [Streptomyces pinistramenti]MCB5911051.1 hypothetical protein [Streptomyces pinistramenti]
MPDNLGVTTAKADAWMDVILRHRHLPTAFQDTHDTRDRQEILAETDGDTR